MTNRYPYSQFNKLMLRRSFNRAAKTYDSAAVLSREIAQRLLERLDFMRLQPELILDIGSATGYSTQLLAQRYPYANILSVDFAEKMLMKGKQASEKNKQLHYLCADLEALPLSQHSVDLIFSNLTLHWCSDIDQSLAQMHHVLKPEGLLIFSTLGPDTLKELRASWAQVDDYAHVYSFLDMHDIGDALLREQFLDPVMDMEMITLTYDKVEELLLDLKALGENNFAEGRCRSLTGKQRFEQFLKNYETYRDQNNKLPATYEIIYGHAWGSKVTCTRDNETGEILIPLNQVHRAR